MGLRSDSARPQHVSGSVRIHSRHAESARNPIALHVKFGDDSALSAFTRTQWTAVFRVQITFCKVTIPVMNPCFQVRHPIRAAVRPASAAVPAAVWPGWTRKSTTHRRRSSAPSWAPTWPCPAPRRRTSALLTPKSGLVSPTSSPRASSSAPTAAASCRPMTRPGRTVSPITGTTRTLRCCRLSSPIQGGTTRTPVQLSYRSVNSTIAISQTASDARFSVCQL